METIDELEPERCCVYAGADGYLGFTGNLDLAWWISIALGVFAAIVCAPIDERPLRRTAAAR